MRATIRARLIAPLCAALVSTVPASSADVGDPAGWRSAAIRAAISNAQGIEDPYRAGETFAVIAKSQVVVGDERGAEASLRSALAKIPSIEQPEFRGWVQHEIVQAQLALNDVIGARETAAAIRGERPRSAAYVLLARRALQAGNVQSAEALASAVREPAFESEILSDIAATRASQGDIAAARAIQRRIDDPRHAGAALAYIAMAQARAGNASAARDAVSKAPRAQRTHAMARYIAWQIERGDSSAALELAQRIDDDATRAAVVARLALDRERQGDTSGARELFASALTHAQRIDKGSVQGATTLTLIARQQALAGFTAEARATLDRVAEAVGPVRGRERDLVLEGLARAHLRMESVDEALAIGSAIEDRISRALLIRDAVALQTRSGIEPAQALRGDWTLDALASTAAQFGVLGARLGNSNASEIRSAIAAARMQVARLEDPLLPPAALAALAAASVRAGDAALGGEILAESMDAAARIDRPEQRALAYVRLANALDDRLMFLGRPPAPAACGPDCAGP